MSLLHYRQKIIPHRFPRVSGDEPTIPWEGASREVFSPRERG